MSKKKVENLLKGVAITGATVGGASVLGDANLAYAAELGEEEANAMAQGEVVLQVTREQTEQQLQTSIESIEEEKTVQQAVEENEKQLEEVDLTVENQAVSELAAASESAATSESNLMSEQTMYSESASTSLSTEDSTIESTSESAATSLSSENSEIASTSTAASESAASENESLSTAISEAEEAYNSASTSFSEEGYQDDYLEDLIHQIEVARAEVEAAQQKAIESNQYLDHESKSNNYYGAGDKLANLLIQYAFYQEGYVGEITYSQWDSSSYHTNSVKVTYIDSTGATKYAYFDYVTVDSDGNALVSGFYDSPNYGSEHDNPYVVDGIMVVKKTVQYTDAYGNILTWKYETETGADGKEQTVCRYYVNGSALRSDVAVNVSGDGTFTLSWSNAGADAKVVAVTEENPGYKSYIYDAADGIVYHDLGMYANAGNEWNNDLVGYTRNSADTTVGVVQTDAEGNTVVSTLIDKNGNTLKLVKKDVDWTNPDQWKWAIRGKTDYTAFSIGGKTYYYYNADIIDKHNGTYILTGYFDESGASHRKQEIKLYTAASARTSSDSFSPAFVARKGDGSEVYTNKLGEVKNGNFGVKGYNYFTLDDFNKGRDEYHEQRSEVTSLSNSLSNLKSESSSLSESVAGSETASESTSQSRAESLSESGHASESASISRQESLSESQAASESKSTSISESLEASLSNYTSESMSLDERIASESESASAEASTAASDSERIASESAEASSSQSESERIAQSTSASASLSDSASTSLSESTSTSLSQSASESASNSAAASETPGNPSDGGNTPASASETNEEASVTTEFNEVNNVNNRTVNRLNEVGPADIGDAQVPLAVRLDDADLDDDTIIEDEETPLGVNKSGLGGRMWWYWILIIISAITGKIAKDKKKATQKEVDDTDK